MSNHLSDAAKKFLRTEFHLLPEREQRVIRRVIEGRHVTHDTNLEFDEKLTFGQRVADRVAAFGGSWTFIMLFTLSLVAWVALNSYILARRGESFDPYPYILLNLFLSMIAALQAPVIMMSQNRQAAKDRLDAAHDYEVNLKAELEIRALHEKVDLLREKQ
ncbi:MAG: DUF1003 domain-containing protein, partial [Acidobacteria bacterium]|nr:DUF1003 domain-containing protein [Acidobacteriota bacterium]